MAMRIIPPANNSMVRETVRAFGFFFMATVWIVHQLPDRRLFPHSAQMRLSTMTTNEILVGLPECEEGACGIYA